MRKSRSSRFFSLALAGTILLYNTLLAFADDKDKKDAKKPTTTTTSKLEKKENPELVGNRDINSRQINFYSLEKEMGIGQQLASEVERQLKLVDDPIINEYINRVGQNIVLNSDAKVPFTIRVVDSDEVNAFALPGGYFFVNKGLILAAENEAEIVGVMAHEIAHVAARHGTEQVSKGQLLQFGSIPLIFLGGPIGIAARSAANFALPLTFLKFSRNAEAEADMLGAQYAWKSGYDPAGMVTMFEKLASKEKNKPGTMSKLFSDHPATGDRANKVRSLISQFPQREEYIVNTSDFNQIKARLVAVSGARRNGSAGANGGNNGGGDRPTLKRRQDPTNGPDADSDQPQAPKDRPTLKRRDNDPGSYDDQQPADSNTPAPASGRPTLKRGGTSDPVDND
jgi:beta-barrel assembly-enhancing protease